LLDAKEVLGAISSAGQTDPRLVEHVFQAKLGRAPSAAEIEEFLERYLTYLPTHILDTAYQILPGVLAALDHLDERGALLGLATGNIERGAEIKLTHGDLWRRSRRGGCGPDTAARAGLVARALERGERPAGRALDRRREIVVIGDTPKDVAAAHACGVPAIGVATGPPHYTTAALAATGADWV